MRFSKGLDGTQAAGRCGGFSHARHREIENISIGLNTCVAHGLGLFAFGDGGGLIGAPATGWSYALEVIDRSWTGMAMNCEPGNGMPGFRCDYRVSMPGAFYTLDGNEFGWDWAVSGSAGSITFLPGGKRLSNQGDFSDLPQVFAAWTRRGPVLFACSRRIARLETISWEHWRFAFDEPGARIMITPLLRAEDVPTTAEAAARWAALAEEPCFYCSEEYAREETHIEIRSTMTGPGGGIPKIAPLPPTVCLAGVANGLQELPEHAVVLQTVFGPYAVADQTAGFLMRRVRTDWMEASAAPTREPGEVDDPLPFELAYAGDASWNESTVMDRLLAWRLWGQRAAVLPERILSDLRRRVPLPSACEFAASMMERTEPFTGRTWAMDRTIFSHEGAPSTASYDVDWYSGLTLSGMRRAAECGLADIEEEARKLAKESRHIRGEMTAYYSIFHDWALSAPWTDARGELYNLDCSHNGLEGILAERRFRQWEGDAEGAQFMEYLAARMAHVFVTRGFPVPGEEGSAVLFGPGALYEWRKGSHPALRSKAPYNLAGDFPEFAALLKLHGPMDIIRRQFEEYAEMPERYADWLAYYVGPEAAAVIRSGQVAEGNQEVREQASVFYHVAPDVATRLFVLDEPPESVMASYARPLPLAERLLCMAAYRLTVRSVD